MIEIPKLILNKLGRRLYFYCRDRYYKISDKGFEKVYEADFLASTMPVLILARDKYSETTKEYPIDDQRDLRAVVKNDFSDSAITYTFKVEGGRSFVRAWTPKAEAVEVIQNKMMLWVPETLLHCTLDENFLFSINRANISIFSYRGASEQYSAEAVGMFSDANYFLMSSGVSTEQQQVISEVEYARKLAEAFGTLPYNLIAPLLRSQKLLAKIRRQLEIWPIAAGSLAGIVLFYASVYGINHKTINDLEEAISEQNVAKVVRAEQEFNSELEIYKKMIGQVPGGKFTPGFWEVIADIMIAGIKVVGIKQINGPIEIRLQSANSTDGLSTIKNMPKISKAELISSIQNYRGEQRYTVTIELASQAVSGMVKHD